jgi:hypothetical protein
MRKEMKDVASVITDDGLKLKQALVQDKQIDYFRGMVPPNYIVFFKLLTYFIF